MSRNRWVNPGLCCLRKDTLLLAAWPASHCRGRSRRRRRRHCCCCGAGPYPLSLITLPQPAINEVTPVVQCGLDADKHPCCATSRKGVHIVVVYTAGRPALLFVVGQFVGGGDMFSKL